MLYRDLGQYTVVYVSEKSETHTVVTPSGEIMLDVDVRASDGVDVNLVTLTGEHLFVGRGSIVSFKQRLIGCCAVEITAKKGVFGYRCEVTEYGKERLDPRPLSVTVKSDDKKDIAALIRSEVDRVVGSLRSSGRIPDEYSDEDLENDLFSDMEFEDEADEHGEGFMEPEFPDADLADEGEVERGPGSSEPETGFDAAGAKSGSGDEVGKAGVEAGEPDDAA